MSSGPFSTGRTIAGGKTGTDPSGTQEFMGLELLAPARAGRLAYESGSMARRLYASASSPMTGIVGRN